MKITINGILIELESNKNYCFVTNDMKGKTQSIYVYEYDKNKKFDLDNDPMCAYEIINKN